MYVYKSKTESLTFTLKLCRAREPFQATMEMNYMHFSASRFLLGVNSSDFSLNCSFSYALFPLYPVDIHSGII